MVLILGGDIFESSRPTEANIGALLRVLWLIKKYELETYVMVGNHEATNFPQAGGVSGSNSPEKIRAGTVLLTG